MILDKLKAKFKPNPDLAKPIVEIGLSIRTQNILRRTGIEIVGDLVTLTRKDIKSYRGAVRKTVVEVERALDGMGLELRGEVK